MAEFDFSGLDKLVDTFVDKYKNALQKADKVATGELVNGIEGVVDFDGRYITVYLRAPEQWKYVEYGRSPGKFPPPDEILKWVQVRGLPMSNYSAKTGGSKLPTQKQVAYLVGRKIATKGIKAGNYLSDTLRTFNLKEKVQKEVVNMVHKRFLDNIKEEISEITSKI